MKEIVANIFFFIILVHFEKSHEIAKENSEWIKNVSDFKREQLNQAINEDQILKEKLKIKNIEGYKERNEDGIEIWFKVN
ncbi:hypothetical protein MXB_3817 [Myxobolus squamalis]|nr:hypothetical protein MXB_3817 [Myxobolus squamalis]